MDATLPLFTWAESRPVASNHAPEGVQRAAKAGGRVDPVILDAARRHVGEEIPKAQLWTEVNAVVTCEPDTTRRRLDALADQGLVILGEPTKLGHVVILGVR